MRNRKLSALALMLCAPVGSAAAEERTIEKEDVPLFNCVMLSVAKARVVSNQGGLMAGLPWMTIARKVEDRIYETLQARGWTEGEVENELSEWYVASQYTNVDAPIEVVCRDVDPALWVADVPAR